MDETREVGMGSRFRDDATQQIETLGSPPARPVEGLGAPAIHPDVYGLTDVGKVRDHNEDSFLVAQLERYMRLYQSSRPVDDGTKVKGPPQGWILIVADGMGGHAGGEVASAMTTDALARYAFTLMPWSLPRSRDDSRVLASGFRDAVKKVQQDMREAASSSGRKGMGTTLTMAYVTWPNLFVVHVGDSRMYAMRESRLYQITHDHTLAQQLVESKVMSSEEAEDSEFSNILVNALGGDSEELRVELHHALLFPGDVFLLCSDGLNKHVSDDRIREILGAVAGGETAESAARTLVDDALEDGGTDNVTCVVARF
ncbi:MAG: protein phosphatase 2C domain-containing protein [Sandaracinaceae bacterium]